MKLDLQPRDDHQVKVIAEFEPQVLEDYVRRAARKIARETRIPGFRPGKAPIEMVRQRVGEEALKQQAIEDLIDEQYPKILEEAKITPGAHGSLEEIISIDPPKLAFVIPLEPEVEINDYQSIRLDYNLEPVTEEEVAAFIKRLQTNYATAEPVNRPAEEGDLVYAKISGTLVYPGEEEEAEVFPERPAQFIIGTNIMQERHWPFVGFSERLTGVSENEEKTINHTFTAEDDDQDLLGKEVSFHVSIQSIKALQLPDLDDNFAQATGEFDSLDALRSAVRTQLENNRQEETEDQYYLKLMDLVIEKSSFKYPPQVLDHEVEHMLEHLKEDLNRQGMEMEAYLKMINKDQDTFIAEEVLPSARKRLERSLVMEKLAKLEEIKLTEKEYNEAISQTAAQLESMPQSKKGKNAVSREVINSMTMNALNQSYNRLVLERIKAIATGQIQQGLTSEPVASEEGSIAVEEPVKKKSRKKKTVTEEQAKENLPDNVD